LDKAIENNLGFKTAASIQWFMEECHNEWEITHEEIHRNGAIAFAILTIIALPVITLIFLKRTRSFNWYCTFWHQRANF
jgi:maltose phosphorylase